MPETVSQVRSAIGTLKRQFNIIAHNLANVNTVGYKRRFNAFSKALIAQGAGTAAQVDPQQAGKLVFDFTQGNLVHSGRPLDFALAGKGFFVIETPDGPLYTRNGMFRLDQQGRIVDSLGRFVAGDMGVISIPSNVGLSQISVSPDGSIRAAGALIGKFRLVDFKDKENQLEAAGLNCFRAPQGVEPRPAENVIVKQGFQETSNVQVVEELVDMIMVTRLYEANMQLVNATKDASKSLINVAMG